MKFARFISHLLLCQSAEVCEVLWAFPNWKALWWLFLRIFYLTKQNLFYFFFLLFLLVLSCKRVTIAWLKITYIFIKKIFEHIDMYETFIFQNFTNFCILSTNHLFQCNISYIYIYYISCILLYNFFLILSVQNTHTHTHTHTHTQNPIFIILNLFIFILSKF